eukprot:CAMPEP_0180261484 /NCGR_PEP_ID=MMETSP0987-20121128/44168_1 /TAXON_ID=697907 /ORGANISM="non described non described, Strain CCMP2293" /LENGTH=201 /DNA_ID=CAMNT_0022231441 /DNA_START=46 /DNA_END=651 /DNA_ORIENTATION=+
MAPCANEKVGPDKGCGVGEDVGDQSVSNGEEGQNHHEEPSLGGGAAAAVPHGSICRERNQAFDGGVRVNAAEDGGGTQAPDPRIRHPQSPPGGAGGSVFREAGAPTFRRDSPEKETLQFETESLNASHTHLRRTLQSNRNNRQKNDTEMKAVWDKQIGVNKNQKTIDTTVEKVLIGDPTATAMLKKPDPPPSFVLQKKKAR